MIGFIGTIWTLNIAFLSAEKYGQDIHSDMQIDI